MREAAERGTDSQELFRSLVAKADEGVVVLEPTRVIRYANAAAEFLLGHRREELVGEMFGLPLLPTDKPVRVNVQSADGQMRVVEWFVEPLPVGPGENLVVRLHDVTALHEDVVSAREQVRRRDEFLAMLSHELRNPLAAIHNAAILLTREDAGTRERRDAGAILHRQFDHLTRILDDLLDITRISQGKLELRLEQVPVNRVVRDAVEAVQGQVRKRNHHLEVSLPARDVVVWGDPTRLEQVVVNLLNNAVKFTPPRGRLKVTLAVLPGEVELVVSDNGPGIPAELVPRIFEPFVQGNQSLERGQGGLGIGLALARSIVQLHDGTINASANPEGAGTAFVVRLPLLPAEAAPAPAPAGPLSRPLRILLVEDQEDPRHLLRQTLQLDGHTVLEAADGWQGLTLLLEQRPDVALVDIGLPGRDGYELARLARQDVRGQGVRLVALTGYGMPRDVQEAYAAGFDMHLTKPLRYPDLCRFLAECSPREGE